METTKVITEDVSGTLQRMKVNDVVTFSVRIIPTVNTTISRLRLQMCVEGADWKREGKIDKVNGTFRIKRIA